MNKPLDAAVEYNIMYMPVEDDTDGGTPILRSRGLKMTPPPRPRAPETHPPIKAKNTNFKMLDHRNSISPSTSPCPYLIFNSYSFFTDFIEVTVMKQHITINPNYNDQSTILHLLMPMIDDVVLLPLNRLMIMRLNHTVRHLKCLSNYL